MLLLPGSSNTIPPFACAHQDVTYVDGRHFSRVSSPTCYFRNDDYSGCGWVVGWRCSLLPRDSSERGRQAKMFTRIRVFSITYNITYGSFTLCPPDHVLCVFIPEFTYLTHEDITGGFPTRDTHLLSRPPTYNAACGWWSSLRFNSPIPGISELSSVILRTVAVVVPYHPYLIQSYSRICVV